MVEELELNVTNVIANGKSVHCYQVDGSNLDPDTVKAFGEEWGKFHSFSDEEIAKTGDMYFDIVRPDMLGPGKRAIDLGCGSGRWTKYLHDKVESVAAIDPSNAIFYAAALLERATNVELYKTSVDRLPFPDDHFDFGFSLGVLHHIPDTRKAMKDCVTKIKPGGYFLVYLYYSLDNRGWLFRLLFRISNGFRHLISKFPGKLKRFVCDVLAIFFYMPFILFSRFLRFLGVGKKFRSKIPLHAYESSSFFIIRNDSLDRFGTPLEQRFSRIEIVNMMKEAGLVEIIVSENMPYWHAVGKKMHSHLPL